MQISVKDLRKEWWRIIKDSELICALCGLPIKANLSADHRIPKSKGGETTIENLQPSHALCNSCKADLMPNEWEKHKYERYLHALNNWNLKNKQRKLLKQILQNQQRRENCK